MKPLTREDIIRAFEMLSAELPAVAVPHELFIMGGAALVLRFHARDSTRDVDAVYSDRAVRDAAARVGARLGLPEEDIADARLLLSKLSGEKEEVWGLIDAYLVPGRELKARDVYEDLWEAVHGAS